MIPSSTLFHYPILKLLSDKAEHTRLEMYEVEKKSLNLSEADLEEKTPGGKSQLASRTDFAITDLVRAKYMIHSGNGYIITDSGLEFYNNHKSGFVANDLKASEAYCSYKKIKIATPNENKDSDADACIKQDNTDEGVVYILTNPAFKTYYIKIGYTTNINERLKELYNTSVPLKFSVYALMKTKKYKLAEKMMHKALHDSRIGDDREFFYLRPEEAYEQMKVVAEGIDAVIEIYDGKGEVKKTIDFSK